jgi:uncharacterized protein
MSLPNTAPASTLRPGPAGHVLWPFLALGVAFGITLTKAEIISWFRIQEMFRFQAFHMYGVLGSALGVAAGSLALLRRVNVKAWDGQPIHVPPKTLGSGRRYWIGGTIFGVGWALTGACPGPLFVLIGAGVTVMSVAVISALAGTWVYGYLRPNLPH